jgi:hypothetical protein
MRPLALAFLIAVIAMCTANADIVKKDLRSVATPEEHFVFFCADHGAVNGVVGFVQGDQSSGFQFDDWFVGGKPPRSVKARRLAEKSAVESCSQGAFSADKVMFVVETDPPLYAQAKDALVLFRTKDNTDTVALAISLGQVIGLQLPTVLAPAFDYFKSMSNLNPGLFHDGGQWIWQPPVVQMKPATPPAPSGSASATAQTPAPPTISSDLIPIGTTKVKYIDRSALVRLYQVLADAEGNPNVNYDIELNVLGETVNQVFVHPLQMKRDSTISRGDSTCLFVNLDAPAVDFVELMDALLTLGSSNTDAVFAAWGFFPSDPLLGVPDNWQAAVTSPPACYLRAASTPNMVAFSPATGGMRYVSTLVRGIPRFSGDPAAFNPKAPLVLTEPTGPQEVSVAEGAWSKYRSFVTQTKAAARIRSGAFARLSASQIAKRRSYVTDTSRKDDEAANFRNYYRLLEIGWHEYQANKYKGLQDDARKRSSDGVASIYAQALTTYKQLQHTDVSPSLIAQIKIYQDFMNTSLFAKSTVADQYDSKMEIGGRVCNVLPSRCSSAYEQIRSRNDPLQWQFGDTKQTQLTNILDIGQISLGPLATLDAVFGAEQPNSACENRPDPPNPFKSGPQTFAVNVTNTGREARNLTLSYVGSFTRATWKDSDNASYAVTLASNETKTVELEFVPRAGYEDYNAIFLTEDGALQGQITLDYSIVSEPSMRFIEVDTGAAESGNGGDSNSNWAYYDVTSGKPPALHSLRKACMWISGDRVKCVGGYAQCGWKSLSDDGVTGTCGLQGHAGKDENQMERRISVCHLRVAYELTAPPTTLK